MTGGFRKSSTMFLNQEYENRILQQTSFPQSPSSVGPMRRSNHSPGGDRFIPSRKHNRWGAQFLSSTDSNSGEALFNPPTCENAERKDAAYKCVLKNELLGMDFESHLKQELDSESRNMFEYIPPVQISQSPFSVSPLGAKSQQLLRSPVKAIRKVSPTPYKVLDAPGLGNDFYLNLVDWSAENVLAVGLNSAVYLWEASTCDVTKVCDLSYERNPVTSVAWNDKGNYLAVGTGSGYVQVWDVAAMKPIIKLEGHSFRVGALSWNGDVLASGSRDKSILQRDIRIPTFMPQRKLTGHTDEVCGLKWSPDGQNLASGGNDNRLHVWNLHSLAPMQTYTQHTAAVKAIAWSPQQHGLLASGGGTADRYIRFWNTLTGQQMHYVDSGSQVCSLAWSKHTQEFVSTHGFSHNYIVVWKYPSLVQVAKLTGHSHRVLHLAMSPNGEDIVTGAGSDDGIDGTLRFWNVFSKNGSQKKSKSALQLFSSIR